LIESQRSASSSLEFLENVKVDLFPDEVYLFTPKGDILALPRNATALDFAYAVHTDVGNHAVAARVDGKLAPLRTKLASGQRVEIITAKSAAPKPQWLEFVVTGK
ncbi:bifunctional (p)ppGpp synthetase/guanosine-3',5'-bis(diphosphate) 3'-pyrophosphohydrolase, partial [Escherichia coli]